MAFTAWSYAEMSRVVPHAGSVFAYATAGLGGAAGFFAGWLALLDYLLIPSVAYLFSGIAMHALVPTVPAWVFTVAAFAATTALNLRGVDVAARVGFVVLLVELAALVVFVVAAALVLAADGPSRPWLSPLTGMTAVDRSMILGGVSIAVLSFLGFDAIASFAEENAGEARQVGRAIFLCLAVAGVAFVAQTALAALLSTTAPADLASHPERQGTAFYDVTRAALGGWLATLIAVTKAIGPAFAAMTAQAAAARLLLGMARDGRLPAVLAEVDRQRGVPVVALASTGALTLIVSVWAARRSDGLPLLVSIVDVGALAAFALLHASVVGYFVVGGHRERRLSHALVPVLGATVAVWVLAEASQTAQITGAIWLACGAGIEVARRR
jgi:amino acid transporter